MMNFSTIKIGRCAFRKVIIFYLFLIGILYATACAMAQDRLDNISNQLKVLSVEVPGLDKSIELSASKMPVQEFLRSIALSSKLNIIVDPALNLTVTNNFTDVPVRDVLVFLAKTYELDITISGRIISISKYNPPVTENHVIKPLVLSIDAVTGLLSMDLRNDSLIKVIHEITRLTGHNVIVTPELQNKLVNGFIKNDSLNDALEKIAIANNLAVAQKEDYFIIYDEKYISSSKPGTSNATGAVRPTPSFIQAPSTFPFQARSLNDISLNAMNIPIGDIINTISQSLHVNYFIYTELKDPITLNLFNVSYEEFLNDLLKGTKNTFKLESGIYLIGERDQQGLRTTRIIKMKYRAVTDLLKVIPDKLKKDITLQEFSDLNSIIVCGSITLIEEVENFLQQIDEVVPLVLIEVIIVDFQNGYTLSTGLSAGIGDKPVKTTGTVGPGVDITLSASSVNNIINSFNGAGLLNLGKITPNFYISLKLLEDQGVVKVRSTPKLSTLNGHEAVMRITKTQYYLEETSQIFANASTTQTKVKQYKSVNADFAVTLTPVVSADNQITLHIKVDQSDFTGTKLDANAPPDQVTRSFTSLIRVKNEEMILLGGLEEGKLKESGSGFPILSRIPILKWIFSSRDRSKSDSRLNIFIKPTIIY